MNESKLRKILRGHALWLHRRESKYACRAVFAHVNLRGANLRGANLSRANLIGAYLRGAYLSGANLSGADLSRADLSRADLREANLSGANLSCADLSGANLSEANLSRANLSDANLSDADLSGAYLREANLSVAYLRRADLRGANLRRADLSVAYLRRADLRGANLRRADLREADLSGCQGLRELSDMDFEYDGLGIIVYKSFREHYAPASNWEIEPGSILHEVSNSNRTDECGSGINVGTLEYCKRGSENEIWRCRIPHVCNYNGRRVYPLSTVVVPYNSTGKIRCEYLELIELLEENK